MLRARTSPSFLGVFVLSFCVLGSAFNRRSRFLQEAKGSKGLVPVLRLNDYDPPRALNESTVTIDFLEDLASSSMKRSLFFRPTGPYARAIVRLQSDLINRTLLPGFYRYLQAQQLDSQIAAGNEFSTALETLVCLSECA